MHTTITKRITGNQMVKVFEENSFVRHFKTRQEKDISEVHAYEIEIRHNDDESPIEILENALKKIK